MERSASDEASESSPRATRKKTEGLYIDGDKWVMSSVYPYGLNFYDKIGW